MCSPLECSGFPWQLLLTNGSHGFYGSSLGFAGVVSLPTPQTGHKSPHRAEFGFRLLVGASKEHNPPFQQSRVKTQTEKKTPLPLFLKINLIKLITPCKRFSNPLKKSPLLCLCGANFALPYLFIRSYVNSYFYHAKQRTRHTQPGPMRITSFFGGDG